VEQRTSGVAGGLSEDGMTRNRDVCDNHPMIYESIVPLTSRSIMHIMIK
jgi:hypothetical protein